MLGNQERKEERRDKFASVAFEEKEEERKKCKILEYQQRKMVNTREASLEEGKKEEM